jgi:hypothetical protein
MVAETNAQPILEQIAANPWGAAEPSCHIPLAQPSLKSCYHVFEGD